ncbi:MAG: GTPase Era [Candidatus Eisenbacteria bacterium]|nr:GTPase Era [Candidatus Eisenbacteria bacterium]
MPQEPAPPAGAFVPPPGFRSGYAAICGYPNVGKSTLLNALLNQRLAIATPKPQTTRRRTLGILTTQAAQMIFVDTPGILDPRYGLQESMMVQVRQTMREADLLVYVTDVRRPRLAPGVAAAAQEKGVLVALNKADLLRRPEECLPAIEQLRQGVPQAEFFAISALRGRGLEPLLAAITAHLPPGPPYYPPEQVTEHPERFFVGELIREAVFAQFWEEVPYGTEVAIDEFRERGGAGQKDWIAATVFVENESQKGILIGKQGAAIKRLGEAARVAIEEFLLRPVFLELHVRVLPNWRRDPRALRRLGY